MKKILLTLLLCCFPFLASAQVRAKVCIVRPNYSEKIVQLIKDFIPRLEKLGVKDPEQYVEDFLTKGSSGSGFVYVTPDGKNYVITNRHVISDAETSTVIFQNEKTKKQKTVEGMKILAADAELDLAILEFPNDERPFTSGFNFFQGEYYDGDTVYSAGYPGLMGKPVWQFGNGIVTNSSVEVEEMIKPELSALIQHSAQIDGGNSGGPLLIKNANDEYEVIGVNTWKLTNRQDTNFAVPAETVEKFINSVLNKEEKSQEPSTSIIVEKATTLQKSLNKYNVTFEELVEYISIDYIANEGRTIFDKVIARCSPENRKTMNTILEKYSPIESVRYAIGWYIFNEYHKYERVYDPKQESSVKEKDLPEIKEPIPVEETDYYCTRLYNGQSRRVLRIDWQFINGGWQIVTVQNTKGSKDETSLTAKRLEDQKRSLIPEDKSTKLGKIEFYALPVQFTYGKYNLGNLYHDNECSHIADVNIKIFNLLSVNLGSEFHEETFHIIHENQNDYGSVFRMITPYAGIQLQAPFVLGYTIIMPYVAADAGVVLTNFDNLKYDIIGIIKPGISFSVLPGTSKFGIVFDLNMKIKLGMPDFSLYDAGVGFALGVAF